MATYKSSTNDWGWPAFYPTEDEVRGLEELAAQTAGGDGSIVVSVYPQPWSWGWLSGYPDQQIPGEGYLHFVSPHFLIGFGSCQVDDGHSILCGKDPTQLVNALFHWLHEWVEAFRDNEQRVRGYSDHYRQLIGHRYRYRAGVLDPKV